MSTRPPLGGQHPAPRHSWPAAAQNRRSSALVRPGHVLRRQYQSSAWSTGLLPQPGRPCNTALTMPTASRVGAYLVGADDARSQGDRQRSQAEAAVQALIDAGRSRMRPMKLFRDTPTKSGEPSATNRGSSLSRVMLCSNPLPKPTPGSSTMASCATPADRQDSRARTRNSDTSATDVPVVRMVLHRTRLALACASSTLPLPSGRPTRGRTRCPQRIDVVDDVRAGCGGRSHHARLAGVDGNRHIQRACDALDDRHDPFGFDGFLDYRCAPGRVDSPPTSMMAAPSATMAAARSKCGVRALA